MSRADWAVQNPRHDVVMWMRSILRSDPFGVFCCYKRPSGFVSRGFSIHEKGSLSAMSREPGVATSTRRWRFGYVTSYLAGIGKARHAALEISRSPCSLHSPSAALTLPSLILASFRVHGAPSNISPSCRSLSDVPGAGRRE